MITNATMQTITCLPTWPWQFDLCLMLLRKQQNTKGCVLQSTQRLLPSAQNKYHHNVVNQCSWRSVFEDFNETSFREKLLRFRWRQQTAGLLYSEKVSSVLLTLQETDMYVHSSVFSGSLFLPLLHIIFSLIISYWKKFKCRTQCGSTPKDRWAGFFWPTHIYTRNFVPASQRRNTSNVCGSQQRF